MADVNFTSLVMSLITCHHCVSFTVALVICKLQRNYRSLVAQWVFTSMMRIMQPANRGLACRIPCCQSQSRLFSASVVSVREAHEYMRAIQPCNMHLHCIVVTSWHCVLHHKLAVKIWNDCSNFASFAYSSPNQTFHCHLGSFGLAYDKLCPCPYHWKSYCRSSSFKIIQNTPSSISRNFLLALIQRRITAWSRNEF